MNLLLTTVFCLFGWHSHCFKNDSTQSKPGGLNIKQSPSTGWRGTKNPTPGSGECETGHDQILKFVFSESKENRNECLQVFIQLLTHRLNDTARSLTSPVRESQNLRGGAAYGWTLRTTESWRLGFLGKRDWKWHRSSVWNRTFGHLVFNT